MYHRSNLREVCFSKGQAPVRMQNSWHMEKKIGTLYSARTGMVVLFFFSFCQFPILEGTLEEQKGGKTIKIKS